MEKRRMGRTAAFLTAFFATLLAMSAVLATLLLIAEFSGEEDAAVTEKAAYMPEEADRLTLLASWRESRTQAPDFFILFGFMPDKGKISVCMLPESVYVEEGGQGATLGSVYEKGGIAYTQKILSKYLDIPIDRHAETTLEATEKLLSYQGLMDYYLPVDIRYRRGLRSVDMPKGNYQLDGRKLADILLCPSFAGGIAEQTDRGGMLLSRIAAESLPAFLSGEGDLLTERLLDWNETDLSWADYEQRKQALRFLAALDLPAASAVFLDGTQTGEGAYRLTDDCLYRIGEAF